MQQGLLTHTPADLDHVCSTLKRAAAEALDGQTIVVKSGTHSLVCDVSSPTLVDKRLQIIGEPGAVLYGGLQFGKHSGGRMTGIEIRGHLWIYGGEWEVHGCKIRNRTDVALVLSNHSQAHVTKCFIGGSSKRKASDGVIAHGNSRAMLEECDIQRCSYSAVTTGGDAGVVLIRCALFDNQACFRVFSPGDRGDFIEASN